MARVRSTRLVVPLGCVALLLALSALAGCGTEQSSDPAAGSWSAEEFYQERYDDLFPDDRVKTVRIVMDDGDWDDMQANVLLEEYYRADIWIDAELVPDVAVRTKGNSSLRQVATSGSIRVGLKVDFNFFNSARSYHGIKKLNYSNGFSDPTLMREFIGYEVMAGLGIPTPRACFVDLWVNDTHLGVYTQVEQVDATFLSDRFDDGDGNLYKPEVRAGTLKWTEADVVPSGAAGASTTTTQSLNLGGGDLEEIISRLDDVGWIPGRIASDEEDASLTSDVRPGQPGPLGGFPDMLGASDLLTSVGLKTNEEAPDYTGLFRMLEVINSDPEQTSTHDLEQVVEVDEILRFLAASVVLVHLDNYIGMGHNYYLYEDGGRFWLIPWDLNMCFGGFNASLGRQEILDFMIDEPTSTAVAEYPLVEQLLSEPEYLERYHDYLRELLEGPFSAVRMSERIDEIAALIRPYVREDENLFYSIEAFEQGLTDDISPAPGDQRAMGGSFIGLKSFVEARTASIKAQLDGSLRSASGDGSGNGGTKTPGGILGGPPGVVPGGGMPGGPQGGAVPGGDVDPAAQRPANRPQAPETPQAPPGEGGG